MTSQRQLAGRLNAITESDSNEICMLHCRRYYRPSPRGMRRILSLSRVAFYPLRLASSVSVTEWRQQCRVMLRQKTVRRRQQQQQLDIIYFNRVPPSRKTLPTEFGQYNSKEQKQSCETFVSSRSQRVKPVTRFSAAGPNWYSLPATLRSAPNLDLTLFRRYC